MAQGALPFQYEIEKPSSRLTALAGLGVLLDFLVASRLLSSVKEHLHMQSQDAVWSDEMLILTLVLLNLVGAEHVEDVDRLMRDPGRHDLLTKLENLIRNKPPRTFRSALSA